MVHTSRSLNCLAGVLTGSYQLVMWQEGLGQGEKTVVVESGEASENPFQIGKLDQDQAADKSKKGKGGQESRGYLQSVHSR